MFSTTLTVNLKSLMSQFAKSNGFVVTSRNIGFKALKGNDVNQPEEEEDLEEIKAREAAIEIKRNKSNLFPADYNKQHGKPPYEEPIFEHLETLKYRRRMYGTYGKLSNVNPSILWPSKVELDAMKEYEEVVQPFTIKQLIKKVQDAKIAEAEERKKAEADLLKKVEGIQGEIKAFKKRCAEREQAIQQAIAKRNELVEKVRDHFGYKMNTRDERFKSMLAELEKDEKERAKAAKKAKKAAKNAEFMERATAKTETSEIKDQ